jgi:hypothetical protein
MKNPKYMIGNRTRALPAFGLVPQPTTPQLSLINLLCNITGGPKYTTSSTGVFCF